MGRYDSVSVWVSEEERESDRMVDEPSREDGDDGGEEVLTTRDGDDGGDV